MRVLTVVGARPQFIKAAPVSKALGAAGIQEILVHTGQHYDYGMSQVFFDEMSIVAPDINLGIGSGRHGQQTGRMLEGLEEIIVNDKPDRVLVYGDTNSTLAGALAAVKLHVPVAHVEAGLRSFNREMPEEHNRVLTDHAADLLFCPTSTAVENLARENIVKNVYLVGDTMFDAVLQFSELAQQRSSILERLALVPREYILATVHRPYNTDSPQNLRAILAAFLQLDVPVIFPVHPRTKKCIERLDLMWLDDTNLRLIDPVGYLDMLVLEKNSRVLLTDSGGMQKEAYFFNVPCVTLRPETEWIETVEVGWNRLAGADTTQIVAAARGFSPQNHHPALYGDGQAARKIVEHLTI